MFKDSYEKAVNYLPIRCSVILICIHWLILFPIAVAIDGHPPIPLMLLEAPGIIAMDWFGKLIQHLHLSEWKHVFIKDAIGIGVITITYGLVGYVYGVLLNKHRNT